MKRQVSVNKVHPGWESIGINRRENPAKRHMTPAERRKKDLRTVQKRDRSADYVAISLHSGQPYQGDNQALLAAAARRGGFISPHWGSYRAWMCAGCQVNKGERSTRVYFRSNWHSVFNFDQVAVRDAENEKARACLEARENALQDATEALQEHILSEVARETSDERYNQFIDYMETHQDAFSDKSMSGVCEDLGLSPNVVKSFRMRAGRDAAKSGVRPLWMIGNAPNAKGLSKAEREEIRNQAAGVPF